MSTRAHQHLKHYDEGLFEDHLIHDDMPAARGLIITIAAVFVVFALIATISYSNAQNEAASQTPAIEHVP